MASEGPIDPIERISAANKKLESIFSLNVDIHKHTRVIGEVCRSIVDIEQRFFTIPETATLSKVVQEISEYSGNDPTVLRVLQSIVSQGEKCDHETQLNSGRQLISVWELTKVSCYADAQDVVIDNLKHNLQTGGGCLPGISARLVQPYLALLQQYVYDSNTEQLLDPQAILAPQAEPSEWSDKVESVTAPVLLKFREYCEQHPLILENVSADTQEWCEQFFGIYPGAFENFVKRAEREYVDGLTAIEFLSITDDLEAKNNFWLSQCSL